MMEGIIGGEAEEKNYLALMQSTGPMVDTSNHEWMN